MKCPECDNDDTVCAACDGEGIDPSYPNEPCLHCHGTGEAPDDDESHLPTLMSVRGIAPGITGDLSSEDYVRRQRDAWPEPEEAADAPRFKPGDRVMVEAIVLHVHDGSEPMFSRCATVQLIGSGERVAVSTDCLHPMPEEGE